MMTEEKSCYGNYIFSKYEARDRKQFMHISNPVLAWAEPNSSTSEYDAAGLPGATTTLTKKQTSKQTACTVPKFKQRISCTVVTRTLALSHISSAYSSESTKETRKVVCECRRLLDFVISQVFLFQIFRCATMPCKG